MQPGPASSFELYGDDAVSLGYRDGERVRATLEQQPLTGSGLRIAIGPARGPFPGRPLDRFWGVIIHERRRYAAWVSGIAAVRRDAPPGLPPRSSGSCTFRRRSSSSG